MNSGDSQNGLQIYSNINSIIKFTSFLCKAGGSHNIENRGKRYYNPSTKTKT